MSLSEIIIQEMAMKSSGEFVLSNSEYKELDDFFDSIGINLHSITVSETSEAKKRKTPFYRMSDKRLEEKYVVKVPRKVLNSIEEFSKEGLELKDWYHDISNLIFSSLGESNGLLFLMFLAATSPRNMLTKNMIEAAKVYTGVLKDMKNNKDLLKQFVDNENFNAAKFSYDDEPYNQLQFVKNLSIGIQDIGSKINNIRNIIKMYLKYNGHLTKDEVLNELIQHLDLKSTTKKDLFNRSSSHISGLKVFNFAINLIEPNYTNNNWYAVTIDSWMIQFFYPFLEKKERDRIFGDNVKYMYLARKVMKEAKKLDLEPNQLQAMIWCAKLKSEGRNVLSFAHALDIVSKRMQSMNSKIEKANTKFSDLIQYMHNIDYSKEEPELQES